LKAVHHIVASSAETIGDVNTGVKTVNLHRPTIDGSAPNAVCNIVHFAASWNTTVLVADSVSDE